MGRSPCKTFAGVSPKKKSTIIYGEVEPHGTVQRIPQFARVLCGQSADREHARKSPRPPAAHPTTPTTIYAQSWVAVGLIGNCYKTHHTKKYLRIHHTPPSPRKVLPSSSMWHLQTWPRSRGCLSLNRLAPCAPDREGLHGDERASHDHCGARAPNTCTTAPTST